MTMTMTKTKTKTLKNCAAMALTLALAACGGGGGGGGDGGGVGGSPPPPSPPAPPPPPALTVSSLQGLWQGTLGATTEASAVVLPDGQAWLVLNEDSGVRLVKATLGVVGSSFSGSGTSYLLGAGTATSVTIGANAVTAGSSLAGTLVSGASQSYTLAYQARYDAAATLADYAGDWQGTLGPGTVNWSVSSGGVLSGTRTTGCTYTGVVSLRAEAKAVVDVSLTEDCAGALTSLAGVATLNADKTRASLALTTGDASAAVLLALTR